MPNNLTTTYHERAFVMSLDIILAASDSQPDSKGLFVNGNFFSSYKLEKFAGGVDGVSVDLAHERIPPRHVATLFVVQI
jgi:hypothetical protein